MFASFQEKAASKFLPLDHNTFQMWPLCLFLAKLLNDFSWIVVEVKPKNVVFRYYKLSGKQYGCRSLAYLSPRLSEANQAFKNYYFLCNLTAS